MNKKVVSMMFLLLSLLIISMNSMADGEGNTGNYSFPQSTSDQAPITYSGQESSVSIAQSQLNADVKDFYSQWKHHYLVHMSTGWYRVAFHSIHSSMTLAEVSPDEDEKNHPTIKDYPGWTKTVSEGQGYGLLIVALMGDSDSEAQEIFDGLYSYVKAHPSKGGTKLMSWRQIFDPFDSSTNKWSQDYSAFDGDADIAYALILAEYQWGHKSNNVHDYQAEANTLINEIWNKTIKKVPMKNPNIDRYVPTLGDWIPGTDSQGNIANATDPRPSDFMYANFRAFAPYQTKFTELNEDLSWLVETAASGSNKLPPDFFELESGTPVPHPAGFLEKNEDKYSWNSGRTPWRFGIEALLHYSNGGTNTTQAKAQSARIINEFSGVAAASIRSCYNLDGTQCPASDSDGAGAFVGPLGVATLATPNNDARATEIYNHLKNTSITEWYFNDTISLISLIIMTNNYWDPTIVAPSWQSAQTHYNQGDQIVYDGLTYEARQTHTSNPNSRPPGLYALWQRPTPANGLKWTDQTNYVVNSTVTYNGTTYVALQAHVSLSNWRPSDVPALWQAQ